VQRINNKIKINILKVSQYINVGERTALPYKRIPLNKCRKNEENRNSPLETTYNAGGQV